MGTLSVLGRAGDTKITWNAQNTAEVENARRTFNDLRQKGYLAFSIKGDGGKGVQIQTFEPHAERLILAPPMAGGA